MRKNQARFPCNTSLSGGGTGSGGGKKENITKGKERKYKKPSSL
jgi:hypothetical protein